MAVRAFGARPLRMADNDGRRIVAPSHHVVVAAATVCHCVVDRLRFDPSINASSHGVCGHSRTLYSCGCDSLAIGIDYTAGRQQTDCYRNHGISEQQNKLLKIRAFNGRKYCSCTASHAVVNALGRVNGGNNVATANRHVVIRSRTHSM